MKVTGKRELKPFMISKQEIEDYMFTKRQLAAYESLKKAVKRCENSGLSLFGQQWDLIAIPSNIYMNQMVTTDYTRKLVKCPALTGASLADSGADDQMYISDKFVKD